MGAAGIRTSGGAVEPIDVADPRPPADDEALIEVKAAWVLDTWSSAADAFRTGRLHSKTGAALQRTRPAMSIKSIVLL